MEVIFTAPIRGNRFFDLEALDQIITLAKCENRQKAMRVCGKLQLAKHAAFLVMQFPASKTDWKDLLAHTLTTFNKLQTKYPYCLF